MAFSRGVTIAKFFTLELFRQEGNTFLDLSFLTEDMEKLSIWKEGEQRKRLDKLLSGERCFFFRLF